MFDWPRPGWVSIWAARLSTGACDRFDHHNLAGLDLTVKTERVQLIVCEKTSGGKGIKQKSKNTNMNILITGDLYIADQFNEVELVDPAVQSLFRRSDLNIVNLEASVTKSVSRILKTGPNMKADKETTAKVLKALEVDVTTLANNHILDYGAQGVMDTIAFCNERGIKTVGSGRNLAEAAKTLFLETKAGKIALVNFAENEWASATSDTAGITHGCQTMQSRYKQQNRRLILSLSLFTAATNTTTCPVRGCKSSIVFTRIKVRIS